MVSFDKSFCGFFVYLVQLFAETLDIILLTSKN